MAVVLTALAWALGATDASGDVVYLVNVPSEDLARIRAAIAPARLYKTPQGMYYMPGKVESVGGVGQDLRIRFTFRAWWRASTREAPVWSARPVELNYRFVSRHLQGKSDHPWGRYPAVGFDIVQEIDNHLDLRLLFSDVDRQVGPIGSQSWRRAVVNLLDPLDELNLAEKLQPSSDWWFPQWPGGGAGGETSVSVDTAAFRFSGWLYSQPCGPPPPKDPAEYAESVRRVIDGDAPVETLPPSLRSAVDPFSVDRAMPWRVGDMLLAAARNRVLEGDSGRGFRHALYGSIALLESLGKVQPPLPGEGPPVPSNRRFGCLVNVAQMTSGTALVDALSAVRTAEAAFHVLHRSVAEDRLIKLRTDGLDAEHRHNLSVLTREWIARLRAHQLELFGYDDALWPASRIEVPPSEVARESLRVIRDWVAFDNPQWWNAFSAGTLLERVLVLGGRPLTPVGQIIGDPLLLTALGREEAMSLDLRQPQEWWMPIQLEARHTAERLLRPPGYGVPASPQVAPSVATAFRETLNSSRDYSLASEDAVLWLWSETERCDALASPAYADRLRAMFTGRVVKGRPVTPSEWQREFHSTQRKVRAVSEAIGLLACAPDRSPSPAGTLLRRSFADLFIRDGDFNNSWDDAITVSWLANLAPDASGSLDELERSERLALAKKGLNHSLERIRSAPDTAARRTVTADILHDLRQAAFERLRAEIEAAAARPRGGE